MFSRNTNIVLISLLIVTEIFFSLECSAVHRKPTVMTRNKKMVRSWNERTISPTDISKLPSPSEAMMGLNLQNGKSHLTSIHEGDSYYDGSDIYQFDSECMFHLSLPNVLNDSFLHKEKPSLKPLLLSDYIKTEAISPLNNPWSSLKSGDSLVILRDRILARQSLRPKRASRTYLRHPTIERTSFLDFIKLTSPNRGLESPFSPISPIPKSSESAPEKIKRKNNKPDIETDYYGFPGFDVNDTIDSEEDDTVFSSDLSDSENESIESDELYFSSDDDEEANDSAFVNVASVSNDGESKCSDYEISYLAELAADMQSGGYSLSF